MKKNLNFNKNYINNILVNLQNKEHLSSILDLKSDKNNNVLLEDSELSDNETLDDEHYCSEISSPIISNINNIESNKITDTDDIELKIVDNELTIVDNDNGKSLNLKLLFTLDTSKTPYEINVQIPEEICFVMCNEMLNKET